MVPARVTIFLSSSVGFITNLIPYIVVGAGGYPNLHYMQERHIE